MMAIQSLENMLFIALTRPPMLFGVTLDYLACSVIVVLIHFLLLNRLWVLLLYIPLHSLGWIACRIDHHLFRVVSKHWYCRKWVSGSFFGEQIYEAF